MITGRDGPITGKVFVPARYKGYYWNTRDGNLYSIKNRKNKPPRALKKTDIEYIRVRGRFIRDMNGMDAPEGWMVSDSGQRVFIDIKEFQNIDISRAVVLWGEEEYFDEDLFII